MRSRSVLPAIIPALAVTTLLSPAATRAQDSLKVGATPLRSSADSTAAIKRQLADSAWVAPDTAGIVRGAFLLVRAGADTGWITLDALPQTAAPVEKVRGAVVKRGDVSAIGEFVIPPAPGSKARTTCTLTAEAQTCRQGGRTVAVLQQPAHIPVLPLGDQNVVTQVPFIYTVGSTRLQLRVPAGFVTDYASVPRMLWPVFPHDGDYKFPAVVHDYLYWTHACTKEQADNLLHIAMQEEGVPRWRRNAIYAAVAMFGQSSWDGNAAKKAAGQARWVPDTFRFPTNISGDSLMTLLAKAHVQDPSLPPVPAPLCASGNTRKVP